MAPAFTPSGQVGATGTFSALKVNSVEFKPGSKTVSKVSSPKNSGTDVSHHAFGPQNPLAVFDQFQQAPNSKVQLPNRADFTVENQVISQATKAPTMSTQTKEFVPAKKQPAASQAAPSGNAAQQQAPQPQTAKLPIK